MFERSRAVFLSYASEDADAAQRICDALRSAGIEVWLDRSELRGGDAWDRQITRQIRQCAVFLALISVHTEDRSEGYFRREWRTAIDRMRDMAEDQPFLLPVAIDSIREDTARVPDRFREVQWIRLTAGETPSTAIDSIKRLLSATPPLKSADRSVGLGAAANAAAARPASPARVPLEQRAALRTSIAVLPLANLTRDPVKEYFSDGMSEELINMLTRVPGLKVPARTSSFAYKGRHTDVRQMARELDVDALLEGSLRSAGDRIRLTVQLVDGRSGYHLWSQNYDRDFEDLFALQDELANAIVQAIGNTLNTTLDSVAQVRPAQDLEAYQLYLRGRALVNRAAESEALLDRAVELLRHAVRRDPNFARAHAAIALAHWVACFMNYPIADALVTAERESERALALDPRLAEAQGILGSVYAARFRWLEADAALRVAEGMDESDGFARTHHAINVGGAAGHLRQAIDEMRAALRVAPANALVAMRLGTALVFGGASDAEAQRHLDLGVDLGYPRNAFPLPLNFGWLALRAGRYAEAADLVAQDLMARTVDAGKAIRLAFAALATGEGKAEAVAALEAVESQAEPRKRGWAAFAVFVVTYAMLGDLDHAYAALNWTLDEIERSNRIWIPVVELWLPEMRPFRQDPRFQALVARFGFMPYWEKYGPPDDCELRDGRLICH